MALGIVFSAGNRLLAASLNALVTAIDGIQVPLWTLSSTTASGTSTNTTETAVTGLTAPSVTYAAHSAYEIKIRGLLRAGTTSGNTTLRIRDTNAAGTLRFDGYTQPTAVALSNTNFYYECIVANTGGADITSRVLALTITHTSAGGAFFNGSTQHPWYVRCTKIGLDTDYPEAVAL